VIERSSPVETVESVESVIVTLNSTRKDPFTKVRRTEISIAEQKVDERRDRELLFPGEEGWLAPALLDRQIARGKKRKNGGRPPFPT
jgi:hypothetical protein